MVDLKDPHAEIYIPDSIEIDAALLRTTHLAIGAHQDDIEILAVDGILECFQKTDRWFTGVVVTNGSGSPRSGVYAHYTDTQMMHVRMQEQKKAAEIGEYAAQILLNYPSSTIKDPTDADSVTDLVKILHATKPEVIYTHNLADKHPTHVGVVVKVIQALRQLPTSLHPTKFFGCEVWRGLDWMNDEDKVALDCSEKQNLQMTLVGVFDSQISGGKRYDLATMGRRTANATYFASHGVDESKGLIFAMNLLPLIENPQLDIKSYTLACIENFKQNVQATLSSVLSS
jgi:LmbE family N-acetylglucosaminyl deacetylase